MNFTVQVAGKTDVGCVRTNNEDNFGYDPECGIFIVCDGMGGAAAGEVASQLGVSTVLSYFCQAATAGAYPAFERLFEDCSEQANALGNAVLSANRIVYQTGLADVRQAGMGTTIAAVLTGGKPVSIAHVGDSRIYLVHDATLVQLTNDHSLVMERVRRGLMTAEEAAVSEMQNVITRALGAEPDVQPDVTDLEVIPGDTLLLSSDGLVRHVSDDQILEIIQHAPSLQAACDTLIEAAKAGGGSDNITCVLLRFCAQTWYQKLFSETAPPRTHESA
jgi:serine/threonine protein phosphatase PrpC